MPGPFFHCTDPCGLAVNVQLKFKQVASVFHSTRENNVLNSGTALALILSSFNEYLPLQVTTKREEHAMPVLLMI